MTALHALTPVDYAVLAVVGVSVLMSLFRGAVREVMSILSWIGAFMIALHYAAQLASLLPLGGSPNWLRLFVAFVGLMIACLLVFALLTMGIARLIRGAGLAPWDRALGVLFGLARAMIILIALVLIAELTPLPRAPAWRDAVFRPPLEAMAKNVRGMLPSRVTDRMHFHS
jgi:membrane protein required for colicin V production